ncbi:Beta-lactamase superfamily domain containing protein [Naviculisporaceae sp. PSN 640]
MASPKVTYLEVNPLKRIPLLKIQTHHPDPEPTLEAKATHHHPYPSLSESSQASNGRVYWIGNATTIIEWHGMRILTDPNFLHAGDHVHLGPGVTAKRVKDPAVDMDQLPPLDCILLSHYHEDHFDKLVEGSINRSFPIISTPHAKQALESKDEKFTSVHGLDFFEELMLVPTDGNTQSKQDTNAKKPVIKVTATPGKHVPPGPLSAINNMLGAVPPTNGWILEMGFTNPSPVAQPPLPAEEVKYRIYISGDTLFVDELKQIREKLRNEKINLMLAHLGGTTIPGPHAPLFMVTMDGKQGVKLMRLMDPEVTIPVHFDDYDVMMSGLEDFLSEVEGMDKEGGEEDEGKEGDWKKKANVKWKDRVVVLGRGEEYVFRVDEPGKE